MTMQAEFPAANRTDVCKLPFAKSLQVSPEEVAAGVRQVVADNEAVLAERRYLFNTSILVGKVSFPILSYLVMAGCFWK